MHNPYEFLAVNLDIVVFVNGPADSVQFCTTHNLLSLDIPTVTIMVKFKHLCAGFEAIQLT